MDREDSFLPLSHISQYAYCPRRAALIMLDRVWDENEYTASGRQEHDRVHDGRVEKRGGFLKLYSFAVKSDKLLLFGKCDCLEARITDGVGASLPAQDGRYRLYPVEYKHGRLRRGEDEYMQQLCAQALCLEEMFGVEVPEGALFFVDAHQRLEVAFSDELRNRVRQTAKSLHECFDRAALPPALAGPRCNKCSMKDICMPKIVASARKYNTKLLEELKGGVPCDDF